jgi:hypothetical protein
MPRRRVATGRAAANRRYVAAVRRQMDFLDGLAGRPARAYAEIDRFLRDHDREPGRLGKVLRGEVA